MPGFLHLPAPIGAWLSQAPLYVCKCSFITPVCMLVLSAVADMRQVAIYAAALISACLQLFLAPLALARTTCASMNSLLCGALVLFRFCADQPQEWPCLTNQVPDVTRSLCGTSDPHNQPTGMQKGVRCLCFWSLLHVTLILYHVNV
jgi:hypothetical protein